MNITARTARFVRTQFRGQAGQMAYYTLLVEPQHKTLSTPAADRTEALAIFGKELGVKLTLEASNTDFATYLLDEWEVGPHWVNPHIPVFATRL